MKEKHIILLANFLFGISNFFAQDTILFKNRKEYHDNIYYAFNYSVEGLNESIQSKIKSTFEKYDLTGPEYDCEYHFTYGIDLDSCGNILDCSTNDKFTDENLINFSTQCRAIIENSDWKIPNSVQSMDSSYFFEGFVITFWTSCEPSEVIFDKKPVERNEKFCVYGYQDGDKFFYFNGFKIGCDSNNQNLKRKKKCTRRKK